METNRYYHAFIDLTMDPLLNLTLLKPKVCVSGIDNTDGTWCKRQTDRLLGNSGPAIHTFLRHYDETSLIPSHPSLLTFY